MSLPEGDFPDHPIHGCPHPTPSTFLLVSPFYLLYGTDHYLISFNLFIFSLSCHNCHNGSSLGLWVLSVLFLLLYLQHLEQCLVHISLSNICWIINGPLLQFIYLFFCYSLIGPSYKCGDRGRKAPYMNTQQINNQRASPWFLTMQFPGRERCRQLQLLLKAREAVGKGRKNTD